LVERFTGDNIESSRKGSLKDVTGPLFGAFPAIEDLIEYPSLVGGVG
jgi:hypothetical protein